MNNYLKFRIGNQWVLLSINQIIIVIYLAELQQIPAADPAFDGLLNYHGSAIPIFNLAKLLELPTQPSYTLDTPIILCQTSTKKVGLAISEVTDILEISASDIQQTDLSERITYIEGLYEHSNSEAWIIDVAKLISQHKLQLEHLSDH